MSCLSKMYISKFYKFLYCMGWPPGALYWWVSGKMEICNCDCVWIYCCKNNSNSCKGGITLHYIAVYHTDPDATVADLTLAVIVLGYIMCPPHYLSSQSTHYCHFPHSQHSLVSTHLNNKQLIQFFKSPFSTSLWGKEHNIRNALYWRCFATLPSCFWFEDGLANHC